MMHFSQFYFGSDAAQPPEIDTNFVEKTVISTKYDLGKRCHFLVSKTKIIKNQCSGASGSPLSSRFHVHQALQSDLRAFQGLPG